MQTETRYAQGSGGRVAYQVLGGGPFDLLLVPGWVSHLEHAWQHPPLARFLSYLAAFSRLIVVDKRGTGLSDRVPRQPRLDELADDLLVVLNAAESARAAILGFADGGPIAVSLAARHPDRVRALVLYGTFARQLAASDYPIGHSPDEHAGLFEAIAQGWGGALLAPSAGDDPEFQSWWDDYLRLGVGDAPTLDLAGLRAEVDVRPLLPALEVPTLVVHRAGDQAVPVAAGRYLAERIQGARYLELPGSDHLPWVGEADLLLTAVEDFLTALLSPAGAGRVLATVLFTDIVSSTELAIQLGDRRWRDTVAAHHALVRRELARWGGREIDTAGDGFLATFDSPERAIRCACAVSDGVRELGIEIRAGIHTGECELMGDRLVGMAVHLGARVLSHAQASEVLVSSTVRDLVGGSDLHFVDRGYHVMKGFPGQWQLFVIDRSGAGATSVERGIPTTPAPAPESPSPEPAPVTPLHNLPPQLTSFVGREREIAEVEALLRAQRLVTLAGIGGLGKTRLSLEVAGRLLPDYPDGVWFVELAPLGDPGLLPQAVAAALEVREEPSRPLLETLIDYLQPRRLLLVLDNCEHLVAACGSLAMVLLRACPGLRLLGTSREALGVTGEMVWRVPALSLPDPTRLPPAEELPRYEAVRLFVERATAVRPGFEITSQNAPAVVRICHRLDGLALAIELAAARVKVLAVDQIAARLDDRFRLLTGGARDAQSRQQTLRGAIDWSHELLDQRERILFRRLAAFAGWYMLEAAESVCADEAVDSLDVLDLLTLLVDKSLVVVDERDGAARYRFLESIRQYAAEKLEEAGEADALRTRHRDWYLDLAEQAESGLQGPEQGDWVDRLEQEHENLRAALAYCRAAGEGEAGVRLAGALWLFWWVRGYLSEGRTWLRDLLALGSMTDPAVRVKALNGAGNLAYAQGDYVQAVALHEEALALRRQLGDSRGVAASLNNLGGVAQHRGDYERAVALHEEALVIRRQLGDSRGVAASLNNLGGVACEQGDYERAATLHAEALAIRRQLGEPRGIAYSLTNLGIVAQNLRDFARATTLLDESLELFRELGDRPNIAACLSNLGEVAQGLGDYERAASLHQEALELRRELGDERGVAISLNNLAAVAHHQAEWSRSATLYDESLALYERLGDRTGIASCLEGKARGASAAGRPEQAARLLGAAEALREVLGAPLSPADRESLEQDLAAARDALGPTAFEGALTEGRAMALDEAINCARAALTPA